MKFCLILFFIVLLNADTLEEQEACSTEMEICQSQVTILINSLEESENAASAGVLDNCDSLYITAASQYWTDVLELSEDLYICDNEVWAVRLADGTYRNTCVAYHNDDFTGECDDSTYFCSLNGNQYGYPVGNIKPALEAALATTLKTHPDCPMNACNPITDDPYWLQTFQEEGVSEEDAGKLCRYGNYDQWYFIENENEVSNTCVVYGNEWNTECVADAGRACSAINQGMNVVGWPKQQARLVSKALDEETHTHPQCCTSADNCPIV